MKAQATAVPAYLVIEEIAERYRKPVETIRYWRKTGFGPRAVRVGSTLLYPRAEVERFDRELQTAIEAS